MSCSRPRWRRPAAALTAVAATAAVTAGMTLGQGQSELTQPSPHVVADPELVASTSIAGGIAVDPEDIISALPAGGLAWPIIDGLGLLGDSTSIAVLPGSIAASIAAVDQSATSLAMLGIAVATTDIHVPLLLFPDLEIPTGQVVCLRALTFATSSTASSTASHCHNC